MLSVSTFTHRTHKENAPDSKDWVSCVFGLVSKDFACFFGKDGFVVCWGKETHRNLQMTTQKTLGFLIVVGRRRLSWELQNPYEGTSTAWMRLQQRNFQKLHVDLFSSLFCKKQIPDPILKETFAWKRDLLLFHKLKQKDAKSNWNSDPILAEPKSGLQRKSWEDWNSARSYDRLWLFSRFVCFCRSRTEIYQEPLAPSAFEKHSGGTWHRPWQYIFVIETERNILYYRNQFEGRDTESSSDEPSFPVCKDPKEREKEAMTLKDVVPQSKFLLHVFIDHCFRKDEKEHLLVNRWFWYWKHMGFWSQEG